VRHCAESTAGASRRYGNCLRLKIRDRVSVRIRDRYEGGETVSCVIPGHERTGEELITDELIVEDDRLQFAFKGTCGYGATFDYAGF
jgi:hypothetical protein